jgi:hypothetical protein
VARPAQGEASDRMQTLDRQPQVSERMQDRGEPADRRAQRQEGREQR